MDRVDAEIAELRRQFLNATAPQDYNAVGLVCVRATEALSTTVYDPSRHVETDAADAAVLLANVLRRIGET